MPTRPMVGCRVPPDWKESIEALAAKTGRNAAQVVYEALEVFLGDVANEPHRTRSQDLQRRVEALESDATLSTLSQSHQSLAQRVTVLEKLVTSLSAQLAQGESANQTRLSSEALASILGITPRAVNQAAEKGREHFHAWVKRFNKGKWDFEVLNSWSKKHDRRFFSIL